MCTEGKSLAPYFQTNIEKSTWPTFAFSQYPRPSLHPQSNSDKPRLKKIRYMGYSVRSKHYRYTEWVSFDPKIFKPDFDKIVARELYDHVFDPEENRNQAESWRYINIRAHLSKIIRNKFQRKLDQI